MNSVTRNLQSGEFLQRLRAEADRERGSPSPARGARGSVSAASELALGSSETLALLTGAQRALPAPGPVDLQLQDPIDATGPTAEAPSAERRWHVRELLACQDRAFVDQAYWAVLRRAPDADGRATYLNLLREGTSKLEILDILCRSPEGSGQVRQVAGLETRLARLRASRWPLIGGLIRVVSYLRALPEALRQQRALEGRLFAAVDRAQSDRAAEQLVINRALHKLSDHANRLSDYAISKADRETVESKVDASDMWHSLDQVHADLQVLRETKTESRDIAAVRSEIGALRTALELGATRLTETAAAQLAERHDIAAVQAEIDGLRTALELGANRLTETAAAQASAAEKLAVLELSKANQSALEAAERSFDRALAGKADHAALAATRQSLVRALETRAERHELTALTNHLTGALQSRPTKEDLAALERSQSRHAEQLAADRAAIDAAVRDVSQRVADTRVALQEQLNGALSDYQASVERFAGFKAELSGMHQALEAAAAEARTALSNERTHSDSARDAAVSQLQAAIESLSQSKTDHHAVHAALEEVKAAAKISADHLLDGLHQSVQARSEMDAKHKALEEAHAQTRSALDSSRQEAQAALRAALAPLASHYQELKHQLLDQERRLGMLLEEARKRLPKPLNASQIQTLVKEEDHLLDSMYASFEDLFRGTREDIRQRQSIYVPYIKQARGAREAFPVVDVGCGRGEWLELLRDEGIGARGVDLNRVFLDSCRNLNLEVAEADCVEYLRKLRRNSIGAVTSFHLIEHLEHKKLIALLDASLEALQPGGIAIFETPNPRNLQVGACSFYMDPTHKHPLPLELMRYLLEARGFVQVQVLELHPCAPECQIVEGAPKVVETLNRQLFSARDYAVIGKKP